MRIGHRKTATYLFLAALLVLVPAAGMSVETSLTEPDSELRQRFLDAERALQSGKRSRYESLLRDLDRYPLYPYLVYQDLRARLAQVDASEIRSFLSQWKHTPLAERLRSTWLKKLAKRHLWREYLIDYTLNDSVERHCDYLNALLHTGRAEEALAQVEAIWLHASSRPEECDPALATWRETGHLTQPLAWARMRLAIDAGETRLAGYLKRFVDPADHADADLWIATRRDPNRVTRPRHYSVDRPLAHQALVAGLQYLARQDPQKAAQTWTRIRPGRDWHLEEIAAIERQIGLSLAYRHTPDAIDWLGRVAYEDDEGVQEWRVLSALRHADWARALRWIDEMDEPHKHSSRWRYWAARCQLALGDETQASDGFEGLAEERSYYGFLAADRIERPYRFHHQSLVFSDDDLQPIAALPGLQRAKELLALERWPDARREWFHATRELSDLDTAKAAKIAHDWGWHARAIISLAGTSHLDDLVLRFPTPHQLDVTQRASDYGLDRAWVFAVARQESAFMPDARSPKGALGLMQIMPATGKEIASKLNTTGFKTRDLLNSNLNLRFGSWYLHDLMNRMQDHRVLVIASYNAGPHRTRRWLPEKGTLAADIWVETVPFRETRRYLRRVLPTPPSMRCYWVIRRPASALSCYRCRAGCKARLLTALNPAVDPTPFPRTRKPARRYRVAGSREAPPR